ncbi:hypothetical protein KEM56_004130 [Ascosphaera pollenicola]|nr:hypothetical protein KEM56_004130 [Ascosphaera pollenicola]
MKPFTCPFCRYSHHDPSTLVQHINSFHVRSTGSDSVNHGGPPSHRNTLSTGAHHSPRSYSGSSALDTRPSVSSSYSSKDSSRYPTRHHDEYEHERPVVVDAPLEHSQTSHAAPVNSRSHGSEYSDAPARRRSSRRLRSATTTDVATPGVIFKGFFNACRNSVGHASKPASLGKKRPIEKRPIEPQQQQQVSPRKIEKQPVNEPVRTVDLGPYGNEKKMPRSLKAGPRVAHIERTRTDGCVERVEIIENETPRIIPLLERFSNLDPVVAQAVYCVPHVRHVFKLEDEGGFGGYRNIQMLISHIQGSSLRGLSHFSDRRLPSILDLQSMIEQAWDRGFNAIGRADTGGIKGTRKYIGTSEAQALFQSKGIKCEPEVFFSSDASPAHEALLTRIWEYFLSPGAEVTESKVITTKMPPMYLQHQGQSAPASTGARQG